MPELGKATYFLEVNSRQYDAALDAADEKAIASSNVIGRSFDKANASMAGLGAKAGVTTGKVASAEEGMAVAANASSKAIVRAHGAAESSYVRMSATGTKAYERMKLGPLAAIGVTLFEGIKTFKENAEAAGLLDKAYANAGRSAGITRGGLDALTGSLEKNTLFTKAEIQLTERLALGYRDVTDKARFVKVATDAAAFSHKGLQMVTLALGRALENPAAGLGKLTRAGISFSAEDQAMAKQITETSGKAAGMAFVFSKVESRVRGSAKAAADNAPWIQLWKQFKEIAATMVGGILPAFSALLRVMNAHQTTVKLLVGVLVALAAAYVAVHTVQKAISLTTSGLAAVTSIYARVTGATAAAEAERIRAARVLAVQTGQLTEMTMAEVAANVSLQESLDATTVAMLRTSAAGEELTAAEATMGKGKAGLLGLASAGNVATVAVLATAAAFVYMGVKAYDAWKNMKKSQASVASDQNVALTAYAHEVNTLVGQGMDRAQAKIKADTDVFNRLGIHVGRTFVDGVGQSLQAGSLKLAAAVKSLMKGLKDGVDSAMAQQVAAMQGGNVEVMKAANEAAFKAQNDLKLGMQGATDILISKLQDQQTKVQDATDRMMARADAQINLWRGRLSASMTHLTDVVFQAFDAATDKGLGRFDKALDKFKDRIQKALDTATKKIDTALKATMAKLQTEQDADTPAEARLKALQNQASKTQRSEALSDAQSAVATAKTPQELAQAQRQLRDAQLAIQEAALQEQADIERAALNKQVDAERDAATAKADAQKAAYTAQLNAQQAAYEKRINQAKKDYASERAAYKEHLQKWLNAEIAWLQKHPGQWKRVFHDLVNVFGPDVKAAATNIGRGFITTFRNAVSDAASKSLHLSVTMHNASVNLGKALATGIVSGLRYLAPDLYNTMTTALNKAINDFKRAHGIRSPSTYTAKHIGEPLGQGIVMGLSRSTEGMFGNVRVPSYQGGAATMPRMAVAGAAGTAQRGTVEIHQHITRVDPDPFQLLQEAKFAADGVFG